MCAHPFLLPLTSFCSSTECVLGLQVQAHNTDVNVVSWSPVVAHLLLSGDSFDDHARALNSASLRLISFLCLIFACLTLAMPRLRYASLWLCLTLATLLRLIPCISLIFSL